MVKMAINIATFDSNLSSVRTRCATLSSSKFSKINLGSTNAKPFVKLSDVSGQMKSVLASMNSLLENDIGSFSQVPVEMKHSDDCAITNIPIANSMTKAVL